MFKVKEQRSRSQYNVTYCYKTATDRLSLSDFKLGAGVVTTADRHWRNVGRPLSCNAFAIATFSSWFNFAVDRE